MTDAERDAFISIISGYDAERFQTIARRYIGKDRGASRQEQASRLSSFLSQEEVQRRIVSMLDEEEIAITLAVSLFSPITIDKLSHLSIRRSPQAVTVRIGDLLERLILLSDKKKGLLCNPLFVSSLLPTLSASSLFGSQGPDAKVGPVVGRDMVRGYLSIAEGETRMPSIESLSVVFPSLSPSFFPLLSASLEKLGIISSGTVDHEKADALCAEDDLAIASRLASLSSPIDETTIRDCAVLLAKLVSVDHSHFLLLSRYVTRNTPGIDDNTLLSLLVEWNLAEDDGTFVISRRFPSSVRDQILLDSDRTVTYSGRGKDDDLLYRFATLEKMDVAETWRMTKKSVIRALDGNLEGNRIIAYLEKEGNLTGSPILRDLSMMISSYRELTLLHCIAITADERLSHLISALPALQESIIAHPSENVFLMDSATYRLWSARLREGIGTVPSVKGEPLLEESEESSKVPLSPFAPSPFSVFPYPRDLPPKEAVYDGALRHMIENLPFEGQKKEGFLRLYGAKRILSFSQIGGLLSDDMPKEAGGFDYQMKLQFLKSAMKSKPLQLEIETQGKRITVIPMELLKTADGNTTLKAELQPGGEIEMLPVSKMFVIRMLSSSLF